MNRSAGVAAKLPGSERKQLPVQALAGAETISELSARLGVSRKFVYAQRGKASDGLNDAFSSAVPDEEVLFQLPVTRPWLRQVMLGLTLICRSSYRGVMEFMRDLLGVSISVGSVHNLQQWAAQQAGEINRDQDLSGIRVGLHDEIFQGSRPVLAGVDAQSIYCYLLAAEKHRDGDTWGVHLLDASRQGLDPDYTIADAGQGLRAGQKAAWDDTPCHGDVFHIQRQCEALANTLGNLARGARTRRQKLGAGIDRARARGRAGRFAAALRRARQAEAQADELARDVRTLTQWLSHDILALAGPRLATRQALFDFIVGQLLARESQDARRIRPVRVALQIALAGFCAAGAASAASAVTTVAGMPPVVRSDNLYSEAGAGHMSLAVASALPRVYVPNLRSNDVYVIDPATLKVVDRFHVGFSPQHVVPAWDLQTLWVANNAEGRPDGSLTPIDPKTGKPGKEIMVDDPYNMYFTPDGKEAIVVAEAHARLDFRDAHTMALKSSLEAPQCKGINHADFSIDGKYALFTCEFGGKLAKIDLVNRKVVGYLELDRKGMPQDIRISPDGKVFYVADMMADGVYVVDGDNFTKIGFLKTGVGTHGLYPSRDGTRLYVSNRGSNLVHGPKHGKGSVSVIDFATRKVVANWPIPGGGSPDMGNVSPDGKMLWLSGRFDDVVYAIDTTTGSVKSIPVGAEPHGLTVWPQPGRYSLGHTGNMR